MRCLICGSKFFDQTYSEPAEDCDCGQRISALVCRETPEIDLPTLQQQWKEECDKAEREWRELDARTK